MARRPRRPLREQGASCRYLVGQRAGPHAANWLPSAVNRSGNFRNWTISWSSYLASLSPATSLKLIRGRSASNAHPRFTEAEHVVRFRPATYCNDDQAAEKQGGQ